MNRPLAHDLPILGGIAGFLHWLESLAVIASGPLLTLGLGVALVDLLTDGKLLATTPWLLMAWAISQAVGIDSQLVGSSFQLAHSLRSRRFLAAAGYGLLVCCLGYVGFIAAQIFSVQQAEGVTTAQALGALGLDSTSWIVQRSALSVCLVVLSGLLRYVQPAKVAVTLADERAQLERDLELEPLRQRARAMKAVGLAGLARTTLEAAAGHTPTRTPGTYPAGPGTPIEASPAAPDDRAEASTPARLRAVSAPRSNGRTPRRVRTPAKTATVERQVRAVWQPSMSVGALQKAAQISRNSAAKWRKVLLAEQPTQEQEWAV
jgi:hypothetical protein